MIAHALLFIVMPTLLAAATIWDLARYTIPNAIPFGLTLVFALAALAGGMAWPVAGWHVAVGALALLAGFALFAFDIIGGGDAKLFAAIVLFMGTRNAFVYTLTAAIFGGVLTLALLWLRSLPVPRPLAKLDWLMRLHDPKQGVPYGVALAAAAAALLPYTDLFRLAAG